MNAPVYVQIIIFVAVSAITLAATRPLVKKWTKTSFSPTNADRCIGKTALVVEDIDNSAEKGAVKINGSAYGPHAQLTESKSAKTSRLQLNKSTELNSLSIKTKEEFLWNPFSSF